MKNDEKQRIFQYFNYNGNKLSDTIKREILTFLFGYKEVESILQNYYQQKQQGNI